MRHASLMCDSPKSDSFWIYAYLFLEFQTLDTQRKWFYNLLRRRNHQMQPAIQQENKESNGKLF